MAEAPTPSTPEIMPTIGRVILFVLAAVMGDQRSIADRTRPALITRVWSPDCVNLSIFLSTDDDAHHNFAQHGLDRSVGGVMRKTSVNIGSEPRDGACHWMPYQQEQAAKGAAHVAKEASIKDEADAAYSAATARANTATFEAHAAKPKGKKSH